MKKQQVSSFENVMAVILAMAAASAVSICVFGWVYNIYKLIGMLDGGVTTMFIARIIGIFAAPVGAVLGYF